MRGVADMGLFGNRRPSFLPQDSMFNQMPLPPGMGGQMPDSMAAPQVGGMPMPQVAPQPTTPQPTLGRPTGARRVAGLASSFLSGALGQPDRYGAMVNQNQQQMRETQLRQQQQAEERAYEESQWRARQDYQRANPEPDTSSWEDNAGNRWRMGPNGPVLVFRDPTPRYQFVTGLDADGNTVMRQVAIPNNVPPAGAPQPTAAPVAPPAATGGLRPMTEREAAPLRASLGAAGFAEYIRRQGFMVVPDGTTAASPQDAIAAEMRRRGITP